MNTVQGAFDFLVGYITQHGGIYSQWYAGIAANPKNRLFSGHGLTEQGVWAFDFVPTSEQARQVEQALFKRGCDGGSGGGDATSNGIYVYGKTSATRE